MRGLIVGALVAAVLAGGAVLAVSGGSGTHRAPGPARRPAASHRAAPPLTAPSVTVPEGSTCYVSAPRCSETPCIYPATASPVTAVAAAAVVAVVPTPTRPVTPAQPAKPAARCPTGPALPGGAIRKHSARSGPGSAIGNLSGSLPAILNRLQHQLAARSHP